MLSLRHDIRCNHVFTLKEGGLHDSGDHQECMNHFACSTVFSNSIPAKIAEFFSEHKLQYLLLYLPLINNISIKILNDVESEKKPRKR